MADDIAPRFQVQVKGEVQTHTEQKLRNLLKEGELSGLELVRPPGAQEWLPLHDLELYAEVVPVVGDPRDVARRRVVKAFTGHATGFAITTLIMFVLQGAIPFWIGIWGIFFALHAVRTAPTALELYREGKLFGGASARPPALRGEGRASSPRSSSLRPFEEEARQIRELLVELDPPDKAALLSSVDDLLGAVHDLEGTERDLAEQTSAEEQRALEDELALATQHREESKGEARRVFERQLEALESRQASMQAASRARAEVVALKSVAINQLKQLRLDLSQARAARGRTDSLDLTSRLEDIRLQMEADREVEALTSGGAPAGGALGDDSALARARASQGAAQAAPLAASPRSPQLELPAEGAGGAAGGEAEHVEAEAAEAVEEEELARSR